LEEKELSEKIIERKITQMQALTFIGVPVTTTNEAEMKGKGVIPAQWGKFYRDQVIHKIPNKKNTNILAVYTDYQSDETGTYTFALGTEVTSNSDVPDGMKTYILPESSYVVFTTRKGPIQEIVVEAWQYIWEW
jgi:predicted transcriptional regulator YdeE